MLMPDEIKTNADTAVNITQQPTNRDLSLVFICSVLSQEIGWEERLPNSCFVSVGTLNLNQLTSSHDTFSVVGIAVHRLLVCDGHDK